MIGKVRSNNVGSQYLVVDSGLAPDKTAAKSMLRKVSDMYIVLHMYCCVQ